MEQVFKYIIKVNFNDTEIKLAKYGSLYKSNGVERLPAGSLYTHRNAIGAFLILDCEKQNVYNIALYSSEDLGNSLTCYYKVTEEKESWYKDIYGTKRIIKDIFVSESEDFKDYIFGIAERCL